jgi:hypothetical protein
MNTLSKAHSRLKLFAVALATFFAVGAFAVPMAFADANAGGATGETLQSLTISALVVTVVVSYVIPIITAFLTKSSASTNTKNLVTAVLAAVNGLIVGGVVNDGTAVLSKESIIFAIGSFILANTSYITLWKPRQINQKAAPDKGLS